MCFKILHFGQKWWQKPEKPINRSHSSDFQKLRENVQNLHEKTTTITMTETEQNY